MGEGRSLFATFLGASVGWPLNGDSLNPALPVMLTLALAPYFLKRGEWTLAWLKLGLVATLFLAPALMLEDGIPSPAATLGKFVPWQGVADPLEGNSTLIDVTFQLQPWQLFLRQQLRAGEAPFWNPHQYSGAPFWANGQSAPLFPLHLLFALLPLQLGFSLLPWLRITVAGLGAWALARELGVKPGSAMVAGLVFPLSGMVSGFLLFPMANSLCLVPWVLRACDRLASEKSRWPPLALLAGLQLLGGHPETFVHTAMLSGLYLLLLPSRISWRLWGGFAAAWLCGAAIAAVQMVPLAMNLFQSSRWQQFQAGEGISLAVIGQLLLRLGLPHAWGHPAHSSWWGPFNYNATAVFAGLLVLPLAWVGLRATRHRRRWRALAGITLFAFLAAYQIPGVRDLLLALPVVGSMLHHRLLFAVDLSLGLLAAAGLDAWCRGSRRPVAEGCIGVAILLAAAWLSFAPQWVEKDLLGGQLAWTLWALAAMVLLAIGGPLGPVGRHRLAAFLPWLVAAELIVAHGAINPALRLSQLFPETAAMQFLQGKPGRVAGLGLALRPNAAMVYGLYDIRGDDTLKLAHYEEVYRQFGGASPFYFQPVERWRHPWVDKLGTRWVVAPPGRRLPQLGWRLAFTGDDAWVYERTSAWPLVRWLGKGSAEPRTEGLEAQRVGANGWEVAWHADRGGTVVVAETWDAGWRAMVDGEPRKVRRVDGTLLGVEVAAGDGTLRLSYRPWGLEWGALLSLAGLGGALLAGRQRWRNTSPEAEE